MHYPHLLAAFQSEAWAILPAKLKEIQAFLCLKAAGGDVLEADVAAIVAGRRKHIDIGEASASRLTAGPRAPGGVQMAGRVALLPVFGTIMHRAGILAQSSGGVSAESLGAQLDALVADRQVRAICMVFDTPGGAVTGVPELAKKIFDFRGDKKIVGIADAFAASAGYWLASQCRELSVAPSGQVGSIGVLAAHVDESKAEEMAGLKTTIVSAGRYKAEFDPSAPLSDEARAELQSKVDDYYQMFTDSVARGRGVAESRVRNNFGEGRMATAKQAVGRQMADRVETLQQLLTRLNAGDADGSGLAIGPGGDSDLEGRRAASTAASTALARAEQVERECFGEAAMARARAEEVERETAGDRRGERGRPINGGRVATGRDAAMARARAAAVERECRGGK